MRLTGPHGNNAFAYTERQRLDPDPKLWIPEQKHITSIHEIELGDEPVFAELDEHNNVKTYTGLKHIYELTPSPSGRGLGGGTYIFDNHNYALYFRTRHVYTHAQNNPLKVIHIDQHSDLTPNVNVVLPLPLGEGLGERDREETIYKYATESCNVGNFIRPALDSKLISECIWIKNLYDLEQFPSPSGRGLGGGRGFILDIDLDFRAPQMETDLSKSMPLVQELIRHASLVTIATSPYFLEQKRAVELLEHLFRS